MYMYMYMNVLETVWMGGGEEDDDDDDDEINILARVERRDEKR